MYNVPTLYIFIYLIVHIHCRNIICKIKGVIKEIKLELFFFLGAWLIDLRPFSGLGGGYYYNTTCMLSFPPPDKSMQCLALSVVKVSEKG